MNHDNPPTLPDAEPKPSEIAVEISDTQSHLKLDPEAIADLIRQTLQAEGITHASISVALVDDATIRVINRRYLDHDWPTDVISFPLSDPGEDHELNGELVISAEMAATTAAQSGLSARDELALYLVHGLLHLCGHDDANTEERDAMRRREDEILAQLGLSNTFPMVAGQVAGSRERESARWTR